MRIVEMAERIAAETGLDLSFKNAPGTRFVLEVVAGSYGKVLESPPMTETRMESFLTGLLAGLEVAKKLWLKIEAAAS